MGCAASAGVDNYEVPHPNGPSGLYDHTLGRAGQSGSASPRPARNMHTTARSLYKPGTVVCASDAELLEALNVYAEWKWYAEPQEHDPEPVWKEGTAQSITEDLRHEAALAADLKIDAKSKSIEPQSVQVRVKGMANSERVYADLEEAAVHLSIMRPPRRIAIPYGCRNITSMGMEFFSKEAARLQDARDLSRDLELIAYYCDWDDDHLTPLGRVSLASLDIGANPRITIGAITRFSAASGELPRPLTGAEGARPAIHFGECDWFEDELVALEIFDAYNKTVSWKTPAFAISIIQHPYTQGIPLNPQPPAATAH